MINNYIKKLNTKFKTGISTEHSYRGDLQILLESLSDDVLVTNEPKRIKCGAPDYIITKNNIPVGYIEAKDIGISLKKTDKTAQLKRYKDSLNNLILTDYLDFRLYRSGEFVTSVAIAKISGKKLTALPQNFKDFENLIRDCYTHIGQTITSASKLAEMMAGKARMMQAVIDKALTGDVQSFQDSSLKDQMTAFKRILIHDIKPSEFADIYAQTIAYGMFAARVHDPTLDDFSRQEAAEMIPKTNPFLRRLFSYIAGPDIDDRIKWIVDALADIFRATDLDALMKNFGGTTQMNDPVIHFYETFLAEYNPKLRKSRGVWYTPEPVVNFIVRAVDDILKTEFGLPQGLADTSKVRIKVDEQGVKGKVRKDVHKVQILDPATGTGTFLVEVIKQIYQKFEGQQGLWSSYVEHELIPRLNGFEILMASYAMTHLKLDMLLRETGYKPKNENRFKVFLTNSLEEAHPDTGTLFASWLSQEATEANLIKRDTPVMVVIGNPPYSVSSSNKSEWIERLTADYKKGVEGFNKNSLSDDYIKFIRYGQYHIDKNKKGVLAYISNNSFIDGITHHSMRQSLLQSFNLIYIIDLHGSFKKQEKSIDGSNDENVFDIQQGVSINIFIKTGKHKNKSQAVVKVLDLYGSRKSKYEKLRNNFLSTLHWNQIKPKSPAYFFKEFDYNSNIKYNQGISLKDLFKHSGTGIKFRKDNLLIKPHFDSSSIDQLLNDMNALNVSEIQSKYKIKDTTDWKITQKRILFTKKDSATRKVQYRLFDYRYTYYPYDKIKEIIVRGDSRRELMKNLFSGDNLALLSARQQSTFNFQHAFISKDLIDMCTLSLQSKESTYAFPLYIYPAHETQQTIDVDQERKPNLDMDTVKQIAKPLALIFTQEKEDTQNTFAPIDILDYIYAVLHSPTYREKYKEFLKIDFARVPYPKNKTFFWQLVELGGELRSIHLLENPIVEQYITTYPQDGDNTVTRRIIKKDYEITDTENKLGRVWINDVQYFGNVPQTTWEFYIGGYQPAKKWLKDRYGRELAFEDIQHYQKIIVALAETDKIMKRIDKIDFM